MPAEGVQPASGAPGPEREEQSQGAESGLYDLSAVPEELRPFVTDELKKMEGNATRKFEEAAEFRKQWEPYAELGVADVPPEEMEQLLGFLEIARDENRFAEWWEKVGEEFGLFDDDEDEGDLEGMEEDELEGEGNIEEVVKNLLDERLGPVEERLNGQDQEERIQKAWEDIRSQLDELKQEHGDFDEDAVCQLAMAYGGSEEAIKQGFEDYQRIVGVGERQFVEGNGNQPETPENGGAPNAAPEAITDFAQASSIAKQRFSQAREEAAR